MSKTIAAMDAAQLALAPAAWDVSNFLKNATTFVKENGGLLLMLVGAAMLIWGGILVAKKLMGNPQTSQQTSWVTIILLLIIGGAFAVMGFSLVDLIGSGGKDTILDLGGTALPGLLLR